VTVYIQPPSSTKGDKVNKMFNKSSLQAFNMQT